MPSGRGNPFPASGPFAPAGRGKRAEKVTCYFADVDGKVERVDDKVDVVGDKVEGVDEKIQVVIDGARSLSSRLEALLRYMLLDGKQAAKEIGVKLENVGDKVQCVDDKVQVVIDGARGLSGRLPSPSNIYTFRRQASESGGEGHR